MSLVDLKKRMQARNAAAKKLYAERAAAEKKALALMRTLTPGKKDALVVLKQINTLLSK